MTEEEIAAAEQQVLENANQYTADVIGVTTDVTSPEIARAGMVQERKVGRKEAVANLNRMTERQQLGLAYDMFVNVPGAYQSFSEITNEDGTINPDTFMNAWETTFQYAMQAGPQGLNFTTKYFDILMADAGAERALSDAEFTSLMAQAEAQAGQLIDPATTNQMFQQRLPLLLGRRPTLLDQRRFFEYMQEQSPGRPGATMAALADEFTMEGDPALSQEYDKRKRTLAGRGVLNAIGIRS